MFWNTNIAAIYDGRIFFFLFKKRSREKRKPKHVSEKNIEIVRFPKTLWSKYFFPEYAEYDCVRLRVDLGRAVGMIEIQPLFKQALEACVEMSNWKQF